MRAFIAALILCASASTAPAQCLPDNDGRMVCEQASQRILSHRRANKSDPRPARWCGWQMRQWFGVADRSYNRAARWRRYGIRARGPAEGVIVVWSHHVGLITGRATDGRWIVKSGNDGHRVRERPRSLRGAIAFRWPEQKWASR